MKADVNDGMPGGDDDLRARGSRRCERENAELRRANEILKTASAFFARRSSTADSQVIVDYIDASS